jgi:hypothetical protein
LDPKQVLLSQSDPDLLRVMVAAAAVTVTKMGERGMQKSRDDYLMASPLHRLWQNLCEKRLCTWGTAGGCIVFWKLLHKFLGLPTWNQGSEWTASMLFGSAL